MHVVGHDRHLEQVVAPGLPIVLPNREYAVCFHVGEDAFAVHGAEHQVIAQKADAVGRSQLCLRAVRGECAH